MHGGMCPMVSGGGMMGSGGMTGGGMHDGLPERLATDDADAR